MDKVETQFLPERLIIRKFFCSDWVDMHEYLYQEVVAKYEQFDVFTENESKVEAECSAKDENF